jgi:hypothetical protein
MLEVLKQALEALELALRSHGVMLLSDPPQDAWKTYGVEGNARQAITSLRQAIAELESQEPVAWLLTDKNINSIQVDSIQRLIDRLKHAHHTDLCVRINGQDEWFQADWLKHMVRVTPPQRTEQDRDEILQAITDPENQPSQFGTVTLDFHFEKIKKWEDLFERMSDKVLAQRTWVGLTDEERNEIASVTFGREGALALYVEAIEAKLKEKNND